MEKYSNKNGNSPIVAYEINEENIKVVFSEADEVYSYSYQKSGEKARRENEETGPQRFWIGVIYQQECQGFERLGMIK